MSDIFLKVQDWMPEMFGAKMARVYAIIYNATNSKRTYFDGSIKYLMTQTGYSKSSVLRYLKTLEESNCIERIGCNSYKNVMYKSLIDEEGAKCQSVKVSKSQLTPSRYQMTPAKCQMTPYKKKDNIYNIYKTNNNINIIIDDICVPHFKNDTLRTTIIDTIKVIQNNNINVDIEVLIQAVELKSIEPKYTDEQIGQMTDEELEQLDNDDIMIDNSQYCVDVLNSFIQTLNVDFLKELIKI